jgi:hypothetical protein
MYLLPGIRRSGTKTENRYGNSVSRQDAAQYNKMTTAGDLSFANGVEAR